MVTITDEKLNEMFDHYIDLKVTERRETCYSCNGGWISGNGVWISGACKEAERWLRLFGVDVSYSRIEPLIEDRCRKANLVR